MTWAEVDRLLREGKVTGVPPGTDLQQFLWDYYPEHRAEIEADNPGRVFQSREERWANLQVTR